MRHPRALLALLGFLCALGGCGGEEPRRKETPPPRETTQAHRAAPEAAAPAPEEPALPEDIARWLRRLESRSAQRRKQALDQLARAGERARLAPVYEAVAQRLRDRNPEVRALAATTLLQLRGAAAVPQVRGLLQDKNEEVRAVLVDAVGKLGKDCRELLVAALRDKSPTVLEIALDHLRAWGEKSCALDVVELLRSTADDRVRAMALRYLREVGSPLGVQAALAAFADLDDANALAEAVRYVGRFGTPKQVEEVLSSLTDRSPLVRRAAAEVAGARRIKTLDAVGGLIQLLEDEDPAVRRAAHASLKALTAQNFGYNPEAVDPEKNAEAIQKWQAWFRAHGKELAEKP